MEEKNPELFKKKKKNYVIIAEGMAERWIESVQSGLRVCVTHKDDEGRQTR